MSSHSDSTFSVCSPSRGGGVDTAPGVSESLTGTPVTRSGVTLGCADGVLVVDETGFVKKGRHSVGVARQYTGTAGRVENSQVGVFLAYAGRFGQALIDRRLYLPRDWAADGARRAKTSAPDQVAFATKPALAREMIAAALDTGMSCAFVLADAVYGSDSRLRRMLEERGQSYVLAVRGNHTLRRTCRC
jgi:SRSO17 transposase